MSAASQTRIPSARRMYYMAFIIVFCMAVAAMSIFNFANGQFNIAIKQWQERLDVIADGRANDVQNWLKKNYGELSLLATNPLVQEYVAQGSTEANQDFLRNVMELTAKRGGFMGSESENANGGIALLDMNGQVLASTPHMPPLEEGLSDFISKAQTAQLNLYDIHAKRDGSLEIGFLVPIHMAKSDMQPSTQVGMILGVKPVGGEFFALLQQPGATEHTLEALLVRQNASGIEYINPLRNSTAPLSYRLQDINAPLAESFALLNPGRFGLLRDYADNPVLFTSRTIGGTSWVLVEKIDSEEALAAALQTRGHIMTILLLSLLGALAAIIAAWHYGTSRNAIRLSQNLTRSIREIRLREEVLKRVTNNHPGAIFLLDDQNRVEYANEEAVDRSGMEEKDLMGKNISAVFGPADAEPYLHASELALESESIVSWTRVEKDVDGEDIIYRSNHIPVDDIAFEDEPMRGVLVVEEDITLVVAERAHRERVMEQLSDSLVRMVDMRDPFAANHSAKVAVIARAIAAELGMEAEEVDATALAGKLMNIGKISVPKKVLTKASGLDKEEKKVIQDSLMASADMLSEVEFDGPVVDIMRQALEHFDGTGPGGLKAEEILLGARIIAAANAFVGMTNPRAYRKALDYSEAQNVLIKQADLDFDRRVVAALILFIEHRGGREELTRIGTPETAETVKTPVRTKPKKGE